VPDDGDWTLVKAFLLGCLHPDGPYPQLAINAEHGSGKSVTSRMLRRVIDPNVADLRSAPKDERDLIIAASNSWFVAFDNLSGIATSLSDALCRLSTGGGFGTRELYSNDDEKLFAAKRPVLFNGIEELGTRPDLIDRCISVTLPPLPPEQRREESDLWAAFHRAHPRILGALLNSVCVALHFRPNVKLDSLPRMADFARWATAGEAGLGIAPGAFIKAYTANRQAANDATIEASAVGPAAVALAKEGRWEGTAKDLLAEFCKDPRSDAKTRDRQDWPKTPKALSNALRRLAPNLRVEGIVVTFPEHRDRKTRRRLIVLEQAGEPRSERSACSTPHDGGPGTQISAGEGGERAAERRAERSGHVSDANPDGAIENGDSERAEHAERETAARSDPRRTEEDDNLALAAVAQVDADEEDARRQSAAEAWSGATVMETGDGDEVPEPPSDVAERFDATQDRQASQGKADRAKRLYTTAAIGGGQPARVKK
jgi:hypothetical protein